MKYNKYRGVRNGNERAMTLMKALAMDDCLALVVSGAVGRQAGGSGQSPEVSGLQERAIQHLAATGTYAASVPSTSRR